MAKLNEHYETIAVFSMKNGEEEAQKLSEKFKELIGKNATVDKVDEWGKRKLAYDINYQSEGYYLLVEFTCTPDFPAELDRIYKITDGVLRSIIVKQVEGKQVEVKSAATEPAAAEAAPAENQGE